MENVSIPLSAILTLSSLGFYYQLMCESTAIKTEDYCS